MNTAWVDVLLKLFARQSDAMSADPLQKIRSRIDQVMSNEAAVWVKVI